MSEGPSELGDNSAKPIDDSTTPSDPPQPESAAAPSSVDKGKAPEVVDDAPKPPPVKDDSGDEDDEDGNEEDDDEEEEEEEDDEPRLKYARLTQNLGAVYRNGDATSAFIVAGDKMIVGTHNGNIHVVQLPLFQSLRVYHAHSASVTAISISPFPPPLPTAKTEALSAIPPSFAPSPLRPSSQHSNTPTASPAASSRKPNQPPLVPNTPSNNIYIATSSLDGNVCIQSLVDLKDVQLRNFARPVQAVALSPEYKTDRTYLSGGLAGHLILTVGGQPGRSTSTTTGTAAATAAGWLGSMGLGANMGRDTILHSGEGTISTIKWSLSGKYVAWLNEHGIKIMRTKHQLESADAESAWKRIGHIDRPQTEEWETMASVWKGRAEWVDEQSVEMDEGEKAAELTAPSPAAEKLRQVAASAKKIERLLVGWGGAIWIIHVHPGGVGVGKDAGERSVGRAEIVTFLRMDCIISGVSLYTQNLLLVLAYCLPDDDEEEEESEEDTPQTRRIRGHRSKPSTSSVGSEPSGGIKRRQNNQPPELRLIDLTSQAEIDKDGLSVSRYERLNASDYHLGLLPAYNAASAVASSKGALEAITGFGYDVWNAAINPMSLFSSAASVKSKNSGDDTASSSKVASTTGTFRFGYNKGPQAIHPNILKPGVKIFIHSPYDCILATKRDLGDHLAWLLERQQYQQAWELLAENPEIVSAPLEKLDKSEKPEKLEPPGTPERKPSGDNFTDEASSTVGSMGRGYLMYTAAEREKRRIGELWIKELIQAKDWTRAGQVCGKVLQTSDQWQTWIYTFASAEKFDEIANYIPIEPMMPPIESAAYEVVLGYYIENDKPRFKDLLERWPTDLFNITAITTHLDKQLRYRDVREDSVDGGQKGRDWRIVMESLARLHEANGRQREALRCYIKLQDADSAFRLIRDHHLAEAVADDIPSFIGLRVPSADRDTASREELEAATSEAITLLIDEAQHGLVKPSTVIGQLQEQDLKLYIFFYLRGLWRGEGIKEHTGENRDRLLMETKAMLDAFADLAVLLFATYDRPLLMEFLKTATSYTFEKAVQECERYQYYDELVYLYAKTGQMKRALFLIIDRLRDVRKAIDFAKEQDDPDLWEDLLNYSMDKPSFIRGLLEQVGTAINPITLVRRIPEGLEIEGLRDGLKHIMKEQEIQYSISFGVAKVLRSEVAAAQTELRNGQRKGIKFEVRRESSKHVDVSAKDVPTMPVNPANPSELETHDGPVAGIVAASTASALGTQSSHARPDNPEPGHCAQCHEAFTEFETDTLVGFACGHVFHLAHLLAVLYPDESVDANYFASGVGDSDQPGAYRYRIGTKVTHARLLKDRIRGGCPVCKRRDEEGDGARAA